MPVVDTPRPGVVATSAGARWRAPSTADGIGAVYDRAETGPPPERGAQCSSSHIYPAWRPTRPDPTRPGTLASGPPRRRRPLRAPWPGPGLRLRRAAALPRRRPPPSSPPPPPGCPKQPPGSDAYRRPLRARSGWCARFGSPQRPTSSRIPPPATPPAAWAPQPNRRLVLASGSKGSGPACSAKAGASAGVCSAAARAASRRTTRSPRSTCPRSTSRRPRCGAARPALARGEVSVECVVGGVRCEA